MTFWGLFADMGHFKANMEHFETQYGIFLKPIWDNFRHYVTFLENFGAIFTNVEHFWGLFATMRHFWGHFINIGHFLGHSVIFGHFAIMGHFRLAIMEHLVTQRHYGALCYHVTSRRYIIG